MRDPQQYNRFSDERSRPFFNLLDRVPDRPYRDVIDLGCGTGELTEHLATRWPDAHVVGLDSSPQMLAGAGKYAIPGRLDFVAGDISDFDTPQDLIFSNAALQWLDDHRELFTRLASLVRPGGVLAVQMPASFRQPSHVTLEEVARAGPWASKLTKWHKLEVEDLSWYGGLLMDLGFAVDAWETTYHFILQGDDPIYEWVKGTTLQPILTLLDAAEGETLTEQYKARLRVAYPQRDYGTVFPFTRYFFVASRPD